MLGEILGAIVGLVVIWMLFGELIMAFFQLIGGILGFLFELVMIPIEFVSTLFGAAKDKKTAREQEEAKAETRRRRNAQKAALHDFSSISELPDDPDLLEEMHADYTKEGDKQRAFVCKMRAQELRTKQHTDNAAKASAAGKGDSALKHWKLAAEQGSPEGAYRVAEALAAKAKTVDQWLEAKEWAEKAANKDYPGARALLDTIVAKGLSAIEEMDSLRIAANNAYEAKEYRGAITLYLRARDMGFNGGESRLAFCYMNAGSSVKDFEQALYWLDRAKAKEKDADLRKSLDQLIAHCHYKLGIQLDEANKKQEALKHFRTASDMGHGEAALMTALLLGAMATYKYELDEVERYARLAKSRGVEEADETLQLIREIRYAD